MKRTSIYTEYIKLDQFLKLAGIISTGGEAKQFIAAIDISVNGETEKRRGRKLKHNDVIKIGNDIYVIEQAGVKT